MKRMILMPSLAMIKLVASLVLAFAMGAAIQLGGTCTLAAVAEIVRKRRANRFKALLEAILLVLAGLVAAKSLGVDLMLPPARSITLMTFAGAVALGLGAYVNRACPLGSLVHIGRGELDFLATPLGFFFGASLSWKIAGGAVSPAAPDMSDAFSALPVFAPLFALIFIGSRVVIAFSRERARPGERASLTGVFSPPSATIAAGLISAALQLVVGDWTYTDLLAELSVKSDSDIFERAAYATALLAGVIAAGLGAGTFQVATPRPRDILRRLAGGLLMGLGALIIPGGHDSLIFMHMPLGRPFAIVAFATICLVMAGAVALGDRLKPAAD